MSLFSGKKLLLAGFIVVLLIGVPLTVYLLQQQQETRTQAQKSTNLTFAPPTTSSSPLKVKVGEQFTFDVMVNPGSNLVSYVRLDIRYDATKLEAVGPTTYAAESSAQFPIIEGPVFQSGRIIVTQSVGGNPTNAIQQQATKIGTLTLKAKEATAGIPVIVGRIRGTQIDEVSTSRKLLSFKSSTSRQREERSYPGEEIINAWSTAAACGLSLSNTFFALFRGDHGSEAQHLLEFCGSFPQS